MPSMNEIVLRSLRKLGVVAEDEGMTASQQASGLAALNSMMAGWRSAGVGYDHAELTGGSEYPLGARWVTHAVHLLAQEIAPDYGQQYGADPYLRQLQAGFMDIPLISTRRVLRTTPSQIDRQRLTDD